MKILLNGKALIGKVRLHKNDTLTFISDNDEVIFLDCVVISKHKEIFMLGNNNTDFTSEVINWIKTKHKLKTVNIEMALIPFSERKYYLFREINNSLFAKINL